jgi:CcmD family protein
LEGGFLGFLENNSIYIVLIIVLVVWAGIFLFLLGTDKRLKAIEKELKEKVSNEK